MAEVIPPKPETGRPRSSFQSSRTRPWFPMTIGLTMVLFGTHIFNTMKLSWRASREHGEIANPLAAFGVDYPSEVQKKIENSSMRRKERVTKRNKGGQHSSHEKIDRPDSFKMSQQLNDQSDHETVHNSSSQKHEYGKHKNHQQLEKNNKKRERRRRRKPDNANSRLVDTNQTLKILNGVDQPTSNGVKRKKRERAEKARWNHRDNTLGGQLVGDAFVGDVSNLLDFAIVGFTKSATTYIMNWLRQQDSISMGSKEICYLNKKKGAKLMDYLQGLDATKLRGFKCPSHFSRTSLTWYRKHFSKTKLIVGLRHPVSWFESFYNFRVRHPKFKNAQLPSPEQMIGKCTREMQGLCTNHARFHHQLARLAKTALNSTERQLLQLAPHDVKGLGTRKVTNPIFLYEVSQLKQDSLQFAHDLAHFLGLREPLKPFVDNGQNDNDNKSTQISICQPKYNGLRQELMRAAVETSDWILNYFLDHVTVCHRESFVQAMKRWKQDPCLAQTT